LIFRFENQRLEIGFFSLRLPAMGLEWQVLPNPAMPGGVVRETLRRKQDSGGD
jgi:hypothetical protein